MDDCNCNLFDIYVCILDFWKKFLIVSHLLKLIIVGIVFITTLNTKLNLKVESSLYMRKMNNPVSVSLLSDDRKPQIRFLGNRHSGSGNLYHKSFRM